MESVSVLPSNMALPGTNTVRDIPLLVVSTASSSERRITPSWTITHLKSRLETITGIAPSAQQLALRLPGQEDTYPIEAENEDGSQLSQWPLVPYAELKVTSKNPHAEVSLSVNDSVPKHEMPKSTYEKLSDTVLDYKRKHQIGRFDPTAPEKQEHKVKKLWLEVETAGIKVGARCCLSSEPTRRGTVSFIGQIPSLPGLDGAPWIGVALDEPFGKNDGSVNGQRYFDCKSNHGLFVRPERIEVGDFPELGLEDDPDMEEL